MPLCLAIFWIIWVWELPSERYWPDYCVKLIGSFKMHYGNSLALVLSYSNMAAPVLKKSNKEISKQVW